MGSELKNLVESIERRVRGKIPDCDKHLKDNPLLGAAIWQSLKAGEFTPQSDEFAGRAVQRLRELDRESDRRPSEDESTQKPPTLTDSLYSETRIAQLAPRIKDLRKEVFGSTKPPFATEREAWDWIIQVGCSEFDREQEKRRETHTEFCRDMEEIQRLANKHGVEIQIETASIPCREPDGQVRGMPITSGTTLHTIAYETELMARYTNFYQVDLIAYVLAGSIPEIPRTATTTTENCYPALPGGRMYPSKSATIEFNTRNLQEKELRTLHKSVRDHITGSNKKGEIDADQIRIWKLVQERGGKPQEYGAKGRFWEEILQVWRSEQNDPQNKEKLRYKTARGVEKAFDNVQEFLDKAP